MSDLERISGASYGTSGILSGWIRQIQNRQFVNCDTLLVNMLTLVRNVYDKNLSYDENSTQLGMDMNAILHHFTEYIRYLRNHDNPSIIFYVPSYHMVPPIHLRNENSSSKAISDMLRKIVRDTYPNERYDFSHGSLRVHVVHVGRTNFPQIELVSKIRELTADCVRKSLRDYWLISHMALDYHLIHKLNNRCILLDSHTGNAWKAGRLGDKVFNNPDIPFNSVTHLLFGDKTLIKSPLKIRDKREAIQLAKARNWKTSTSKQIVTDVSGMIDPKLLTTLKL